MNQNPAEFFRQESKFMKRMRVVLAAMLIPAISMAGTMGVGHVKEIQINKALGNVVFVQLDAMQTNPIACHTNLGWSYTLPQQSEADKKMFAVLTMAMATGQTVRIYGSGACSDFGAVESAGAAAIQQ
jgi:hypothetical protein